MQDQIQCLEKITKTKQYSELPSMLRSSLGALLKISKLTHEKLNQHYDLYYQIVSKTQQQNLAIEREITRLARTDHFDEESMCVTQEYIGKESGLDKVMIQEVKELAEAVVENRLGCLEDEVLKKYNYDIEMTMLEEQIESLKEKVDSILSEKTNDQVQSKIKEHKLQILQQFSKTSRLMGLGQMTIRENQKILRVENQIESIKHSINNTLGNENIKVCEELKGSIEKKAEKKDFLEFKGRITKQLAKKATIQEVETVVTKFQEKVFEKMNDSISRIQDREEIGKMVRNELGVLLEREGLGKQTREKGIKKELEKFWRKVEPVLEEMKKDSLEYSQLKEDLSSLKERSDEFEDKVQHQFSQLVHLITSQLNDRRDQTFNISSIQKPLSTIKLTSSNMDSKNRMIPWEYQQCNLNRQNYLWEQFKTHLYIVCPGIYYVKVVLGSMKKISAELMINGEGRVSLGNSVEEWSYKMGQTLFYVGMVTITQKSKVAIKVSEDARVDAAIVFNKMV